MVDLSHLDKRYFVDRTTFNCPFCKRNNVVYEIKWTFNFSWDSEKTCHSFLVECSSCKRVSLHHAFRKVCVYNERTKKYQFELTIDYDKIDECIFHSIPTSFFVLDARIPKKIRELIDEADGCLKMNHLTGASGCLRKAIWELLIIEGVAADEEKHYEEKVKSLKDKRPDVDPGLIDILGAIQGMASDKLHEMSWEKWDSKNIRFIIETLKAVLNEIYVIPDERAKQIKEVMEMRQSLVEDKKEEDATEEKPEEVAAEE